MHRHRPMAARCIKMHPTIRCFGIAQATFRNLCHISSAPLPALKNRPKPQVMTTRAKTLRLKRKAIKWLAPARRD